MGCFCAVDHDATFRTPAAAHFGRQTCCFHAHACASAPWNIDCKHGDTLVFSSVCLAIAQCVFLHRGASIASSAVFLILSSVMLWWLLALTRVFLHRGASLLQPF